MLPLISVAPMMGYTDRHARYFLRLLAPHVQLYTEMVTCPALIHGDVQRFLAFDPAEKYVALQLGGHEPQHLAHCARLGEEYGYDEINLNVGCPSDRVKSGQFGACLMLKPQLVAECVASMIAAVRIPVTVKCRIGVDDVDSYQALHDFIQLVAASGCQRFIIHARKAWLSGLSPKQNREVPPLRYEVVRQIKQDFPHLEIVLNGGLTSLSAIAAELPHVDGVMIGRAAYANPYLLAELEQQHFPSASLPSRHAIVEAMFPYIQRHLDQGLRLNMLTRHLLGLFQGQPGAAAWRRHLSEHAWRQDANLEVLKIALACVPR